MADPAFKRRELTSGSVLSFSARSADPFRYRVLESGADRMSSLLAAFPNLAGMLVGRATPFVVNHYPAPLGPIPSGVVVDTYMRQVNFSKAMHLSKIEGRTCVLLGQPLSMVEAIRRHCSNGNPFPTTMVVVLGGYACPASLERFLSGMLTRVGAEHAVLHGYGVAEVEYGVFVGQRRGPKGDVLYKHVARHVEWKIDHGRLCLKKKAESDWVQTDEHVSLDPDGLFIRNSPATVAPAILSDLESWEEEIWQRRTGYVCRNGGYRAYQCRQGVSPTEDREMEFFEFCKTTEMSYLDKPDWR